MISTPAYLDGERPAVVTQTGVTVLFASHDPNVQEVADRIYELQDGRLAAQINGQNLSSAELPISHK